jgi:hypothetical protein
MNGVRKANAARIEALHTLWKFRANVVYCSDRESVTSAGAYRAHWYFGASGDASL